MLSESAVRLVQTYGGPSSKLFPSHLVEREVPCFLTGYKKVTVVLVCGRNQEEGIKESNQKSH